jgi:hypothetical protein
MGKIFGTHLGFLVGKPQCFFYTFYLVYIWHYRIKLFLRHLPNCPCSNFSRYVDLFQEISPRIAKQLRFPEKFFVCVNSYLQWNYFNVSIFRWSLCHFYEIICLLLCFFSDLYFLPKNSDRMGLWHFTPFLNKRAPN